MNQTQPLFNYQQKPTKVRFRTNHSKEQSIALRKQVLLWLFTNRSHEFRHAHIQNKCIELKICRNLHYYLCKANILVRNSYNNYNWNPELANPDFSKLVEVLLNAERARKTYSRRIHKKVAINNELDLNIINQKLDLICKALGLC